MLTETRDWLYRHTWQDPWWPVAELAGVIQPLGGEYAVTREFAESVPFAAGYGVEIGLLLDAHSRYGLDGIAPVSLGVRKHRNRNLQQLGVMFRQILGAALDRCGLVSDALPAEEGTLFTQFTQVAGEWLPTEHEIPPTPCPPVRGFS
jgi:glucosyl-3-phosphoglycerate synthase